MKWSIPAGQAVFIEAETGGGSQEEGGKGALPGAGTKLFIDRNFKHNQQVNSASLKWGINNLIITKYSVNN